MHFLTRKEASDYLISLGVHYSRATLQKLATVGGGPVYRICGGRALYTVPDLDTWIEERMSPPRRSTSEVVISPDADLPGEQEAAR